MVLIEIGLGEGNISHLDLLNFLVLEGILREKISELVKYVGVKLGKEDTAINTYLVIISIHI